MLREQLIALSRTPHFNVSQESYVSRLLDVVESVVENHNSLPPDIPRLVLRVVWRATKYLNGNTLNETPYEVVYSLSRALKDWTVANARLAITTALLEDQAYHFDPADPSDLIRLLADPDFRVELVQIALPRLYRHRPIYNVALYHELGHFIDKKFQVVTMSRLLRPEKDKRDVLHRREFLSDLVAASYTGMAIVRLLEHIAPDAPDSEEHPATARRIENVTDFLGGKNNDHIQVIQDSLIALKLPKLEIRFSTPNIASYFDNMRPYTIRDDRELHGILEAGWEYLKSAYNRDRSPWKDLDEQEINRVVNDLIEKSIRNWMISRKWNGTTH